MKVFCALGWQSNQAQASSGEVIALRHSALERRGEVPRVLYLGICLDFHHFLWRVLLPQFGFHIDRDSLSQALVESSLVPPGHPLECHDFYLGIVIPPASMD